jgi:hypothetical protein
VSRRERGAMTSIAGNNPFEVFAAAFIVIVLLGALLTARD